MFGYVSERLSECAYRGIAFTNKSVCKRQEDKLSIDNIINKKIFNLMMKWVSNRKMVDRGLAEMHECMHMRDHKI